MMLKSLVGAALLALSLNAGAATTPKLPVFEGNTDGIPSATDVPYSEGDFKKESAAAVGRASRTVAQSANFENMMSPQMKQLRADILSIRSSDELDAKLKTLAADEFCNLLDQRFRYRLESRALLTPLASMFVQAQANPSCHRRFWLRRPKVAPLWHIARTDLLSTSGT